MPDEASFKLDNETITAALENALLNSLDATTKETLVKDALKAITERASAPYGGSRESAVERAFAQACRNYADECIKEYFAKNESIKRAIAAICQQAVDMLVNEEYSPVRTLAADAVAQAIRNKLYE